MNLTLLKKIANIFHEAIKKERKNTQIGKRPTVSYEKNINEIMDKIGLKYDYRNNCIDVFDQVKWEKTSIIYRISFKMLSTTNSLESYHGHINKLTPRKNNFFTALCRIATNLNQHNQNYLKRIKHSINYTISSTKKQIEKKIEN